MEDTSTTRHSVHGSRFGPKNPLRHPWLRYVLIRTLVRRLILEREIIPRKVSTNLLLVRVYAITNVLTTKVNTRLFFSRSKNNLEWVYWYNGSVQCLESLYRQRLKIPYSLLLYGDFYKVTSNGFVSDNLTPNLCRTLFPLSQRSMLVFILS